jgi:uncharacterized membrane protein
MKKIIMHQTVILTIFYLGFILIFFRNEFSYFLSGYDLLLLKDYSLYDESGRLAFEAWRDTVSDRKWLKYIGFMLIVLSMVLLVFSKKTSNNNRSFYLTLSLFILSLIFLYLWPIIKIIFLLHS